MAQQSPVQNTSFSPDMPVEELIATLKREREESNAGNEVEAMPDSNP